MRAESLCEIFQSARESHGRLVNDNRAGIGGELGESSSETLLEREETFEHETVARYSGGDECRHECRRPGEALHLDAGIAACTGEHKAGIADAGCTGIGNERDILAGEEILDDTVDGAMLIIAVMASHRGVDIVMLHEHGAGAGILSEYQIRLLEDTNRAEGHILEVANGRRDNM